jgi:M6 family metalloprotease-like protein
MARKRFVVLAMTATLVVGVAAPAEARSRFPRHKDPRSWEVPEDMTWSDYRAIPGVDWREGSGDPPKKLRAALILGDFQDQGFRVSETTVDATGQRGLGVEDPAAYWLNYLFYDKSLSAPQHGHTVDEYWLENSYGLVGVEAEAFGPYKMDGNMYEYGVRDFGSDADCPDGPDGCQGEFDTELVEKSLVDVTLSQQEHGEFDFRFLLHAGYDESGVWLNYGLARFTGMNAVTDLFGPANPDHRNWATTRYVPWTSFFSAQQIWSHALPGALSTQGESDGGSTYAHELSHILGVLDNYNNPYAENPDRAYSGPWDMMSRGTFNGPGGPFERNQIPPTQGGTMGSHHMLRNKIRMGFTPPSEVLNVTQSALDAAGIVRGRVMQRETPPRTDDPDMYSGIRIQLTQDNSSCDSEKPKCDGGGYDFYDVEVVNRQGFDSFLPDHGVVIAKSKAADASPFIWVIDAFPKDINRIDYVAADGTEVPYTVGDYRQLADAAFHAGTAPRTKNTYFDRVNNLAFYILKKRPQDGRLTYDIAVQSLSSPLQPEAPEVERVKGRPVRNEVVPVTFRVTNPGVTPGVYRLTVKRKGAVKTRLMNDLVYLDGGASKNAVVWVKKLGRRGSVQLEAIVASEPR